jgi:imidazolonepropionase-like amidohydrolase
MKIIALLLLTLLVSCSTSVIKKKQGTNSFILSNVNIVDVENQTIIPSKTIIIKNGKIDSITDKSSPLTNQQLEIIDGKSGFITPGLIDMHVHMYEKAAYILTLSHGVTHVRIMNGVPKHLTWRDNIAAGKQVGSTSTVSSPIISGYKEAYLHHGVETAKEARAAVKEYHMKGYDLIKAYGNLNEVALSAIVNEGKNLGIPIAKHGPHATGDMAVSQLKGFQSFEHIEDIYQGPLNYKFAPEKLPGIAKTLKATNVPITPTLNIFYQLTKLSLEKEAYLAKTSKHYTSDIIATETSSNQVKRWLKSSEKMATHNQKTLKFLQHITKVFHEHGIPLMVGSDSGVLLSPHGLATHNEMRLLKKAGLSTFDILAAATITPAKALNLDKQIGEISVNYNADFIYSSTNPTLNLSVLKTPEAVIKNGHWYSRDTLNAMRDEAIDSRSFWEEFFLLLEAL